MRRREFGDPTEVHGDPPVCCRCYSGVVRMSRPRRLIAWVASAATPIATIARSAVGQRPDRGQELVGTPAIHDAEHGVTALGQAERPLAAVLGLLVTLDEPPPDEAVDEPARGRRRPADRLGQLTDRQGVAVGEDVQGRELGEPEAQLPELAGEADDELAPERPAHGDALADLADVRQPIAGREDRGGQVRLEAAGDGAGGCRPGRRPRRRSFVGHVGQRTAASQMCATMHGRRAQRAGSAG